MPQLFLGTKTMFYWRWTFIGAFIVCSVSVQCSGVSSQSLSEPKDGCLLLSFLFFRIVYVKDSKPYHSGDDLFESFDDISFLFFFLRTEHQMHGYKIGLSTINIICITMEVPIQIIAFTPNEVRKTKFWMEIWSEELFCITKHLEHLNQSVSLLSFRWCIQKKKPYL